MKVSSGEGLPFFISQAPERHLNAVSTNTLEHIRRIAEPVIEQAGVYLLDVEILPEDGKTIWLYVDSEQGDVSLDICTRLSREISFLLDAHEVVSGAYRLNISSPGLDRPLRDIRQYRKNIGRTIRIRLQATDRPDVLGILTSAESDTLTVTPTPGKGKKSHAASKGGADRVPSTSQASGPGTATFVSIALSEIREAKIEPSFS